MKTEEVIENNKLIAEFMGHITSDNLESVCGFRGQEIFPFADLEYHTSWDWLMPVVEKIETYLWVFSISGLKIEYATIDQYKKGDSQVFPVPGKKIIAVYEAVVFFIKWYNEQQKF